ncbi:MAG: Rha family transcriptional regulator [Colwellia sp.]|nr:Rha family transcriptional regulator [Colwellia sp.]
MSDIVIVKDNVFFIDSEGLAELSQNEPRAINQLIKNRTIDLERFGGLSFEMINPTGDKGGRPKKLYYLNEQQATLLTTFMKNSDIVREFKYKLVNEFFKMREYINNQKVTLAISLQVRKSLTDAVEESGEQERMHNHGFSTYTLMVYKFLGIKKDYQAWKKETKGKGDFRKTLPVEMREKIANAESLVKGMLNLHKQHNEIRDTLEPLFKTKEIK